MTQIRSRAPVAIRAYGSALRTLARIHPSRADRLLAKRFCTPARHAADPAADLFGEAVWVRHGESTLPVWRAGEGPVVLLAHGWASSAAFWDPLARRLVQEGLEVVAFDMPAHGRASGRRTHVFQMRDAVARVARHVGALHGVVGHSAGGAAAVLALRDGMSAPRAVLLAVPARPAEFIFPLAHALGLGHERGMAALAAMGREVGLDPWQADTPVAAESLRIPALVVHDRDDRRAPLEDARAIVRAWRGARLLATDELGHSRVASDPEVMDAVAGFLGQRAAADEAPLPRRA